MKSFCENCKFAKTRLWAKCSKDVQNWSASMIFKYSTLEKRSIVLCYVLRLLKQHTGSPRCLRLAMQNTRFREAQKQALSTENMWNIIPLQRPNLGQGCQNPPSSILFWKTVQPTTSGCSIDTIYSTERNARPKLSNKTWETWAPDLAPEDVSVYDRRDVKHKTRIWRCLVPLQVGLCYVSFWIPSFSLLLVLVLY